MPATLTIAGIPDPKAALDRQEKAGLRYEQPGKVARSGEEKASHVPASRAYGRASAKVSEKNRL